MTRLLIRGGLLVTPTEEWFTDILLEGSKIVRLGTYQDDVDCPVIDATGKYVTPGLFDIQVNGSPECDFWKDLNLDQITALSQKFLAAGITSILPTLITGNLKQLCKNRDYLKKEIGLSCESATKKDKQLLRMPGLHFEGPCLSPKRPGVHPTQDLQPLELSILKTLVDDSCLLMTFAPELDPSGSCINFLREAGVHCSLGHSDASYEEAQQAFDRGVSMMTHTFNALPALHHRAPGAVGAALLDRRVSCCMIPDGLHVAPSMLDLIFRVKGVAKTILVSDVAAIGTSQGTLVGSSLMLSDGVSSMVKWGIATFAEAVRMATYNPAKALQLEDKIGNIKPGAYADLLLWDRESIEVTDVIFNGSILEEKTIKSPLAC